MTYKDFVELQNKLGGTIYRKSDGTYFLNTTTGNYYNHGRKFFNGKMSNYDLNHILKNYSNVNYVGPYKWFMDKLAKKLGKDAKVVPSQANDGTFKVVQGDNVYYISNGQGRVSTPEGMRYYDINTGEIAIPRKAESSDTDTTKDTTKDDTQPTDTPAQKTQPIVHTATYTPTANATGVYALSGWSTNEWGGGKRGVLEKDIAAKLGLGEEATAKDAQNKLIELGYNIDPDNYWGKQSQSAYNDYINRSNIKVTAEDAPVLEQERHNYSTYNPQTKQYSYDTSFEVTPQQLKEAGITNFKGYQNFMNNQANATNNYQNIFSFFNRVKEQNENVDFNNESSFNKFFNTKGRYGRRDRNRIISAAKTSQQAYDRVSPTGAPLRTDFGKQYDALYNTLDENQRNNIIWVRSGNTQVPIYQKPDGTYQKLENGKLVNTGTYSRGEDGTYSVSFKKGGSIGKFQFVGEEPFLL